MVSGPRRPRATDIDRQIGARIRQHRLMLGLTQQQLADRAGVGCQQAFDYEVGADHIVASRLSRIAAVLGVEPACLMPGQERVLSFAPPHQRAALELASAILAIAEPAQRQAVCDLVRSLPARAPAEGLGLSAV